MIPGLTVPALRVHLIVHDDALPVSEADARRLSAWSDDGVDRVCREAVRKATAPLQIMRGMRYVLVGEIVVALAVWVIYEVMRWL